MKTAFLVMAMLGLGAVLVMAAVYSYKCPNCGLIQQYDHPGIYNCPKDNWILVPVE